MRVCACVCILRTAVKREERDHGVFNHCSGDCRGYSDGFFMRCSIRRQLYKVCVGASVFVSQERR